MSRQPHVLIITYYWPPAGGGGVQRWLHFSKNLKALGTEVTVLTVREEDASYPLKDESLNEKVAQVRVVRTRSSDPLKWYARLSGGSGKKGDIPYGSIDHKKSLFKKISAWIRGNLFLPDARKGWVRFAVPEAAKLLKQEAFTHIITTGPPHSSHFIGLKLKQQFPDISWLADLRDPGAELYFNEQLFQSNWAKKRNLGMEKKVLHAADLITTVGHEMKGLLAAKTDTPVHAIYNGYDESLFKGLSYETTDTFTITHLGLLGAKQPGEGLAQALAPLIRARHEQ